MKSARFIRVSRLWKTLSCTHISVLTMWRSDRAFSSAIRTAETIDVGLAASAM